MRKWVVAAIVFIFLSVIFVGVYLRLDRYIVQVMAISDTPKPLRRQSYIKLSQTDPLAMRGVLARVVPSGIWVWREWKPTFIPTDVDTIYSYWYLCVNRLEDDSGVIGEAIDIPRHLTTEVAVFAQRAVSGHIVDFYFVNHAPGTVAREVHVYDWRLNLPQGSEGLCIE